MTKPQATKKLTRAEACAELARRIWPDATCIGQPFYSSERLVVALRDARSFYFDPFTSRDAAAELVEWVCGNPSRWERFTAELDKLTARQLGEQWYQASFRYLLAKPEQITLAVCTLCGIEVE